MKEIKLYVDGIMCNNCVSKINTALSALDGCDSSMVSEDYSKVYVKYNEKRLSLEQIIIIIENIKGKSFNILKKEEINQ